MSLGLDISLELISHFLLFLAPVHPRWFRLAEVTGYEERRARLTYRLASITALLPKTARPATYKSSHGFGVVEVALLIRRGMRGVKDG